MEIWDLYDKDGQLTGQTIQRGVTVLPPDTYHLVVHFWIRNSRGEYLLQKRSEKAASLVGIWSFTGGSVTTGEDSLLGMQREVEEEIGYQVPIEEVKRIRRFIQGHCIIDVYLLEKDVPLIEFTAGEEVSEVKYENIDSIELLRTQKLFWELDDEYMRIVYES